MKFAGIFLIGLCCLSICQAQAQASSADIIPGRIRVKVKPAYQDKFTQQLRSGRAALPFAINNVRSLAPAGINRRNSSSRAQALKPVVDISLYFDLEVPATTDIPTAIRDLYAKGWVELAEPVYRQQLLFTPDDPALASQYYLQKIRAFEAWDITQGSEDRVVAIVDSGGDLDHPDLASQLYINVNDPVNGIDDDNNGFIDDYRGWDFSGAEQFNIVGDNDPSVYKSGVGFTHGTGVGSCASAATNNGTGIAGIGFRTKLMFTKHFSDDQDANSFYYTTDTYLGVLYAAHQGVHIINCSWGTFSKSQIAQDIINYVTLDLGCLVVAAAGNSNVETSVYPASYDNVVSVAASDENDNRAFYTSFGRYVDLSAPGVNIYFAAADNTYKTDHGTSFSSPMVCGAAALVWSHHPEFTPQQVAEQLRATADPILYTNAAPQYAYKLGKGRMDVYKALTASTPAVRADHARVSGPTGGIPTGGDMATLAFDFTNYLQATSTGLTITVQTSSSYATVLKGTLQTGSIGTMKTKSNVNDPFVLQLSTDMPRNYNLDLILLFSDGDYQDYQHVTLMLNPTYVDITENKITTSLSEKGRIGFDDSPNQIGRGFIFNTRSILYEMGLMVGNTATGDLFDAVRNSSGSYNHEFLPLAPINKITPGARSYAEVYGTIINDTLDASRKLEISYRSLVWPEAPDDQYIIVEYIIQNTQDQPLLNLVAGLFADWDISLFGAEDAANWDASRQLGYVSARNPDGFPFAGIQMLSALPNYYAIDNDQNLPGNSWGVYDGFSDDEKFTTLTTMRTTAGQSTTQGNDVSHVVSAGPYTLQAHQSVVIAFALHAANTLADLQASADRASRMYKQTLQAPLPVIQDTAFCANVPVTLKPSGASQFKWYTQFTGGTSIASGSPITFDNITGDTVFYVSNADFDYESVRRKVLISRKPVPTAAFTFTPESVTAGGVIQFTDASTDATRWQWNFDDGGTSTAQNPSHQFAKAGDYTVSLVVHNAQECTASTSQTLPIITAAEQQVPVGFLVYPVPAAGEPVTIQVEHLPGQALLTIENIQGKRLRDIAIARPGSFTYTIDRNTLTPGIYIIRLISEKHTTTRKLIIQR